MIENFPLIRLRFTFSPEEDMELPSFTSSALRGAWGHALKRQLCTRRLSQCEGCSRQLECEFPILFETPQRKSGERTTFVSPPQPYVIEAESWQREMLMATGSSTFDVVLIGNAIRSLPLVVESWRAALAGGIGQRRVPCRLLEVTLPDQDNVILFRPGKGWLTNPATLIGVPVAPTENTIHLRFHTPLRIRQQNDLLGADKIMPADLLMALVRRISLVADFHAGERFDFDLHLLRAQAVKITGVKNLSWHDWTRFSSRQKSEMQFGGLVGDWVLKGDLSAFWPFLYLGQWLHVGKNATFGFGGYKILSAG